MNLLTHKTDRRARRLLVFTFGAWLAGVGCSLCCAPATLAAERGETVAHASVSAPAHCPAHAPRATVASSSDTSAAPVSREGAAWCCEKSRQPSALSGKQQHVAERDSSVAREKSLPLAASSYRSPITPRQRSPDGRAVHVRCRVFLI